MHRIRKTSFAITLALIATAGLVSIPAAAQPGYTGPGTVPPGQANAPDPGFEHNQLGRNGRNGSMEGSVPNYGGYCGPLPSHVCHGGGYSYLSHQDPFAPNSWTLHAGNFASAQLSAKKGWPLQTLTVLTEAGEPVPNARVRFFVSGYAGRGIFGKTDEHGRFQVPIRKVKRSHRFLIGKLGYGDQRLDVTGRQITDAEHQIVLRRVGNSYQKSTGHQVAVFGGDAVPARLAKDYQKARKAIDAEKWSVAIAELAALVERWPVGTLEDGGEYQPQELLVKALEGAGEETLAQQVGQRTAEVVAADIAG